MGKAKSLPRTGAFVTWSGSFTAADQTGAVQDASGGPVKSFSLQVKNTGFTAWTVDLEGTIDGTNWDVVSSHSNVSPGDGQIAITVDFPVLKARAKCSAVTGAGTLAVSFVGVQ